VRVDLPRCPLGALTPGERPTVPRVFRGGAAVASGPGNTTVDSVFAFVVVAIVAGAAGVGLHFYWNFALAALIAVFLFMRRAARF